MKRWPMHKSAALLAAGLVLAGCNFIGPKGIRNGRMTYNDVIHRTSMEQNFINCCVWPPTSRRSSWMSRKLMPP